MFTFAYFHFHTNIEKKLMEFFDEKTEERRKGQFFIPLTSEDG